MTGRTSIIPRPDLVIPKDTSKLPQPVDAEATTSSPDWPETPEQRIARIRSTAGKVQSNTGDYTLYDVTTQLQSEKQGVLTLSGTKKGQTAADGATQEAALPTCSDNADAQPGVNCIRVTARKYLTEPPTAYRIPAASAPTGEEAFTEEDLLKRKQRKKAARDAANGTARKSTVVWE